MNKHEKAVADFLAQMANEDPDRYRAITESTPLREEATASNTDDVDAMTGAIETGMFRTAQNRRRQVTEAGPAPTPTRPIPEQEWASTSEAQFWYLHTKKAMSYAVIASMTGRAEGTVKASIHKAKAALAKLQSAPTFSMRHLLEELRDLYDPAVYTEEEDLSPDLQDLTYAEIAALYADEDDDYEADEDADL